MHDIIEIEMQEGGNYIVPDIEILIPQGKKLI